MTIKLNPAVAAGGVINEFTTEEAISANEVVAKSETTNRILKAQASTWDRMPAFGVATETKSAGETISVIRIGQVTDIARDEDFGYDDRIFVSPNAGKATKVPPTAVGNIVQTIGRGLNTSDIILQMGWIAPEQKEI